ncbi:hypothetical protein Tco_0589412 [Tanacetum coccineum]
MSMTTQSSVKDKILATPSETSKVENAPGEMLCDLDQQIEKKADDEAYTTKYSIHPGADTMLCGFRLTNRWLSMKKDIASYGSKYLAYSEVEVEYQGSSGLLLQPELPE